MVCVDMEEEKERSFEKTQSDKEKQPQEKAGLAKPNKRDAKAEDKAQSKLEQQKLSHAHR